MPQSSLPIPRVAAVMAAGFAVFSAPRRRGRDWHEVLNCALSLPSMLCLQFGYPGLYLGVSNQPRGFCVGDTAARPIACLDIGPRLRHALRKVAAEGFLRCVQRRPVIDRRLRHDRRDYRSGAGRNRGALLLRATEFGRFSDICRRDSARRKLTLLGR
jgi:hypothetical protein